VDRTKFALYDGSEFQRHRVSDDSKEHTEIPTSEQRRLVFMASRNRRFTQYDLPMTRRKSTSQFRIISRGSEIYPGSWARNKANI